MQPQKWHKQDILQINLCVIQDAACHELFFVLGNFYVSWTRDVADYFYCLIGDQYHKSWTMELFEENHFKQYLLIFSNYATVFLMCKKYAEAY